jgi:hypothetical protein
MDLRKSNFQNSTLRIYAVMMVLANWEWQPGGGNRRGFSSRHLLPALSWRG